MVKRAQKKKTRKKPDTAYTDANLRKWGRLTHERGWTYVPNLLLVHQSDLGITPSELNVLLNIMKHWWSPKSLAWPSVTKVAKQMGRDRSTVQRHLRNLERRKLIKRIYRKDTRRVKANLTNRYDFSGLVNRLSRIAKDN